MKINDVIAKGSAFLAKRKKYIRSVNSLAFYNDEPKMYQFTIEYKIVDAGNAVLETTSGVSFDRNVAIVKLIGETLERFAMWPTKETKKIVASYKDLRKVKPVMSPAVFMTHKTQLSDKEIRDLEQTKITWVEGKNLSTNSSMWVPLITAYTFANPDQPYLVNNISSGAATGTSLEEALYRGLCELIERDSFMIAYLNSLSLPLIDLAAIKDKKIQHVLSVMKRYNLQPFVVNTTTDIGVPAVVCVLLDTTGIGPVYTLGGGAGSDFYAAILHALEESIMIRSWQRDQFYYRPSDDHFQKNAISERAKYWYDSKMLDALTFFYASTKRVQVQKGKKKSYAAKLAEVVRKVRKVSDIYYVDLTPQDAREAGFVVVKVIAPSLVPLYLVEKYKPIGLPRLYKAPVAMGVRKNPLQPSGLNPVPQPFL